MNLSLRPVLCFMLCITMTSLKLQAAAFSPEQEARIQTKTDELVKKGTDPQLARRQAIQRMKEEDAEENEAREKAEKERKAAEQKAAEKARRDAIEAQRAEQERLRRREGIKPATRPASPPKDSLSSGPASTSTSSSQSSKPPQKQPQKPVFTSPLAQALGALEDQIIFAPKAEIKDGPALKVFAQACASMQPKAYYKFDGIRIQEISHSPDAVKRAQKREEKERKEREKTASPASSSSASSTQFSSPLAARLDALASQITFNDKVVINDAQTLKQFATACAACDADSAYKFDGAQLIKIKSSLKQAPKGRKRHIRITEPEKKAGTKNVTEILEQRNLDVSRFYSPNSSKNTTPVDTGDTKDEEWEDDKSTQEVRPDKEIQDTYNLLFDRVKNEQYKTELNALQTRVREFLTSYWHSAQQELSVLADQTFEKETRAYQALSEIRKRNSPVPQKIDPPAIAPDLRNSLITLTTVLAKIIVINQLFKNKSLDEGKTDVEMHLDNLTQDFTAKEGAAKYGTIRDIIAYYNDHIKDSLAQTLQEAEAGKTLVAALSSPPSSPTRSAPSSSAHPASGAASSVPTSGIAPTYPIKALAARITFEPGATIKDAAALKKFATACATMDTASQYRFDGTKLNFVRATPTPSQKPATSTSRSTTTTPQGAPVSATLADALKHVRRGTGDENDDEEESWD